MTIRAFWGRCPFPFLGVLFVGIVVLSAVVSVQSPNLVHRGLPFLGPTLATFGAALVIEVRRNRPNNYPWLDFGPLTRLVLYVTLFIVGAVVVLPGFWPTGDVEWPLRIPAILLAISFPALLAIHLRVDHRTLEETGVRRSLVFASRLPLYFIGTVVVLTFLASAPTFLGVLR